MGLEEGFDFVRLVGLERYYEKEKGRLVPLRGGIVALKIPSPMGILTFRRTDNVFENEFGEVAVDFELDKDSLNCKL